jgi:CubicO group peptidase (beta-lactamase class C family)
MTLVEGGTLTLDAPVLTYLSEFARRSARRANYHQAVAEPELGAGSCR